MNFIPSSTPAVSGSVITVGTAFDFQTEQGQVVVVAVVSAKDAVLKDPFNVAVMTAF